MDTVIARRQPQDPERIAWYRQTGGGELRRGESDAAGFAAETGDAQVVWLAPSEAILLTEVRIANARELRRAAPYALEDELAGDLDELHFAYGPSARQRPTPIAVVAHEVMRDWLGELETTGIAATALLPDVLALPLAANSWSLLLEPQRCLIRTGEYRGLACTPELLDTVLASLLDESEEPPASIRVWRCPGASSALPALDIGFEEQACDHGFFDVCGDALPRQWPLNLLQAPYRVRKRESRHAPWWIAAGIAASWLLVAFVADLIEYNRLATLKTEYQQAAERIYFESFPDARKAPDPRLLMEQRLESLRSGQDGSAGPGFLGLVRVGAEALRAEQQIEVSGLRYRNDQLEVELTAPDASALDRIKQRLASQGLTAELQSLNTQGERVSGKLELKP